MFPPYIELLHIIANFFQQQAHLRDCLGCSFEDGKRLFALDSNGTGFPFTAALISCYVRSRELISSVTYSAKQSWINIVLIVGTNLRNI